MIRFRAGYNQQQYVNNFKALITAANATKWTLPEGMKKTIFFASMEGIHKHSHPLQSFFTSMAIQAHQYPTVDTVFPQFLLLNIPTDSKIGNCPNKLSLKYSNDNESSNDTNNRNNEIELQNLDVELELDNIVTPYDVYYNTAETVGEPDEKLIPTKMHLHSDCTLVNECTNDFVININNVMVSR